MIQLNETFAVKPVAAWKSGTDDRVKLGYQLKLVNTTQKTVSVNKYQFGPGIADAALAGDRIFPTAEAALAAWETQPHSVTANAITA